MDAATYPSTADANSMYLNSMQVLTAEIEGAMRAIASDDLTHFAESVARQEVLVSSLASLRRAFDKEPTLKKSNTTILVAGRELQLANLKYAALLKHSGATIAMLSALCNSHMAQTAEARDARSRHQTWSCEM